MTKRPPMTYFSGDSVLAAGEPTGTNEVAVNEVVVNVEENTSINIDDSQISSNDNLSNTSNNETNIVAAENAVTGVSVLNDDNVGNQSIDYQAGSTLGADNINITTEHESSNTAITDIVENEGYIPPVGSGLGIGNFDIVETEDSRYGITFNADGTPVVYENIKTDGVNTDTNIIATADYINESGGGRTATDGDIIRVGNIIKVTYPDADGIVHVSQFNVGDTNVDLQANETHTIDTNLSHNSVGLVQFGDENGNELLIGNPFANGDGAVTPSILTTAGQVHLWVLDTNTNIHVDTFSFGNPLNNFVDPSGGINNDTGNHIGSAGEMITRADGSKVVSLYAYEDSDGLGGNHIVFQSTAANPYDFTVVHSFLLNTGDNEFAQYSGANADGTILAGTALNFGVYVTYEDPAAIGSYQTVLLPDSQGARTHFPVEVYGDLIIYEDDNSNSLKAVNLNRTTGVFTLVREFQNVENVSSLSYDGTVLKAGIPDAAGGDGLIREWSPEIIQEQSTIQINVVARPEPVAPIEEPQVRRVTIRPDVVVDVVQDEAIVFQYDAPEKAEPIKREKLTLEGSENIYIDPLVNDDDGAIQEQYGQDAKVETDTGSSTISTSTQVVDDDVDFSSLLKKYPL